MHSSYFQPLLGMATGLVVSLGGIGIVQAAALEFKLPRQVTTSNRATTQSPPLVVLPPSALTPVAHSPVALRFVPGTTLPLATDHRLNGTIAPSAIDYAIAVLFAGDTDSLVATAVGSAEGTRTPNGGYTSAYYGHVDPGNGVWNLGSFSYQHGAVSPEVADRKQLRRLQQQARELRRQAQSQGFRLSLLAELNGIDLANQAPLAALDRGYIDWLAQARSMDLPEPIIWARTQAFLDPDTGAWDAPGLGNHWEAIYRDQRRRYNAIAHTLALQHPKN